MSWAPALCRCSRHTSHARQWTGLGQCMQQLLEVAVWGQVATHSRCHLVTNCAGCLGALLLGICCLCALNHVHSMPAVALVFSTASESQQSSSSRQQYSTPEAIAVNAVYSGFNAALV
jgi:hypothetical protein